MNISDTQQLALDLMDWHSGGGSGLYSLASTMFALKLNLITQEMIDRACRELEQDRVDYLIDLLQTWWLCFNSGQNI